MRELYGPAAALGRQSHRLAMYRHVAGLKDKDGKTVVIGFGRTVEQCVAMAEKASGESLLKDAGIE